MANAPKKSGARPPPPLDHQFGGDEHRQFPRAKMAVPFKLWMGECLLSLYSLPGTASSQRIDVGRDR